MLGGSGLARGEQPTTKPVVFQIDPSKTYEISPLIYGANFPDWKTMAGRIVCASDGTWRRTRVGRAGTHYAAYIGDPASQAQRNIFAVRECLRRHLPESMRDGR